MLSLLMIVFAGHPSQAEHMAASMPVPINVTISFLFVLRVIIIFSFRVLKRVCSVGCAGHNIGRTDAMVLSKR